MVEYMTNEKLRYYQEFFAFMDTDSSGTIYPQQLLQILRSMHIRLSQDDVNELIRQTGNQTENLAVSLNEFLAIISIVIQDKVFNEEIYEVFRIFDIDKSKVINKKDLELGFEKMELEIMPSDIEKMLSAAGKDHFTLKEFRQFILDK